MTGYRKVQIKALVDHLGRGRSRAGGQDTSLANMMELAETMARALDNAVKRHDQELHAEFSALAAEIVAMKRDIAAFDATDVRFKTVPEAGRELDAVTQATEAASNAIMSAAEDIMSADRTDLDAFQALVDEKMIVIFEACSFQDITGQRIAKVVRTLKLIEERVGAIAERLKVESEGRPETEESAEERRRRELILNGPALPGKGIEQDDVDTLLSNQNDIDALFG